MVNRMPEFIQETRVLAAAVLEWHNGGGSPLYQIGSAMYAGKLKEVSAMYHDAGEYASIAELAILNLRSNDDEESDRLANLLEMWILEYEKTK